MSDGLATVDLDAVEILEADVRIHGRGSPPEGDLYSTSDLEAMAQASRELAGELVAPAKIGHDGDQPAVGWLENVRVEGRKLIADVKRVPRQFAELVKARAYRTRSAELSRVRSQRTGKTYENVITGLAWLGGKMPAVRTLGDVVALYGGVDIETRRAFETPGSGAAAASELLDEAVREGRIPYAQRAPLEQLAAKDAAMVRQFVEECPPDWRQAKANWAAETDHVSRELDAAEEALNRGDPAAVRAIVEANRAAELEAALSGADAEFEIDDDADRELIAREFGIPIEDVF